MVEPTTGLVTPLQTPAQPSAESTTAKTIILSPTLENDEQKQTPLVNIEDYTVLGESIDYEMKEKFGKQLWPPEWRPGGVITLSSLVQFLKQPPIAIVCLEGSMERIIKGIAVISFFH